MQMNVETLGGQQQQQAKSGYSTKEGFLRREKNKSKNKKKPRVLLQGDDKNDCNNSATKKRTKFQQHRIALALIHGNHQHPLTSSTYTTTSSATWGEEHSERTLKTTSDGAFDSDDQWELIQVGYILLLQMRYPFLQ